MRIEAEEAAIAANVEPDKNPGVSDKENLNTSNIELTNTSSIEPALEEKTTDDTATVDKVVNNDPAEERDKKLQEIREICIEKLPLEESQSTPAQSSKFVEPSSSSEDEQAKKEKKLKRNSDRKSKNSASDPGEASQEEIEEMIRCVSRGGSRPTSQNSRPGSQLSRPGSALPKKVAKKLESLGSPERDSPVLAPRQRQKEIKEREAEAARKQMFSPKPSTPAPSKSPIRSQVQHQHVVNDNYLKRKELNLSMEKDKSIGSFEMAYARKKQSDKIKKLIEKQKRKAEKMDKKKYQGFGDKKQEEDGDEEAKEQKKEQRQKMKQKKKDQVLKKAQVSQAESDLMKELLKIGESALFDSAQPSTNNQEVVTTIDDTDVQHQESNQNVAAIKDFEESQTIDDSQNLSEELDKLFELH